MVKEGGTRNRKNPLVVQVPLRPQGTPRELAEAMVFVLADKTSFITGTDLLIDGSARAASSVRPETNC